MNSSTNFSWRRLHWCTPGTESVVNTVKGVILSLYSVLVRHTLSCESKSGQDKQGHTGAKKRGTGHKDFPFNTRFLYFKVFKHCK